jgi:hypothetical protein
MKMFQFLIAGFRLASSTLQGRIAFPLLSVGTALLLVQPCTADPFQFETTGSLATPRDAHTATLLLNGKVLVAGGDNGGTVLASAELYDPATGMWTATGSLSTARVIFLRKRGQGFCSFISCYGD